MIIARKIERKRKRSDKNCQWLKNEKENGIMHTTNIKEEIKEKMGFPGGSDSKGYSCNVKDLGAIPGLGRSPGEGNGYPLMYFWQDNSIYRGAWRATVHGVCGASKSWT